MVYVTIPASRKLNAASVCGPEHATLFSGVFVDAFQRVSDQAMDAGLGATREEKMALDFL